MFAFPFLSFHQQMLFGMKAAGVGAVKGFLSTWEREGGELGHLGPFFSSNSSHLQLAHKKDSPLGPFYVPP